MATGRATAGTGKRASRVGQVKKDEERARAAAVDELGELDAALASIKPKIERRDALRRQIQKWAEDAPADKSLLFTGAQFVAVVSERQNERTITSLPEVYKIVGHDTFLKKCTLTLKALEEIVPAEKRAQVLTTQQTGPRTVKTAAKAA